MYIPPTPKPIPYIGGIVGTNVLGALLHVFLARPEAGGEVTRGYLHGGGLLIDFVGQEGPTSKLRLVALDLLVLFLQLLALAATVERQALKTGLGLPPTLGQGVAATMRNERASARQDHDSEERGVRRESAVEGEDIELQDLNTGNRGRGRHRRVATPAPSPEQSQSPVEPRAVPPTENDLDVFMSGDVILSDFHLLDTVRRQWWTYENARSRPPV